jgi:hypothetical protein
VIADKMAGKVAQRITDTIFPAKVLVVRDRVVTLNRGEGTDIAVGEVWEAFAQGEALIDPDTGENLGSEEVAVGFVRVISVAPKFSRAEVCGIDRGIAKGCILRKTTKSSCDDAQAPKMYMPVLPQDSGDAAPPLRGAGQQRPDGPAVPPVQVAPTGQGGTQATSEPRRYTAAIFIRNREKRIDEADSEGAEDAPDDLDFTDDGQEEDADFRDDEVQESTRPRGPGEDSADIYRKAQEAVRDLAIDEELLAWEKYLEKYPKSLFRDRIEARTEELSAELCGGSVHGSSSLSSLSSLGSAAAALPTVTVTAAELLGSAAAPPPPPLPLQQQQKQQ